MRAILLGAGRGHRLRPLTDDRPACLLPVGGRPLLEWQIQALLRCRIQDIVIVRGWARARIGGPGLRIIDNPRWDRSGAMESLRCATEEIRGHVVILPTDRFHASPALQRAREQAGAIAALVDPEGPFSQVSGGQSRPETLLVGPEGLLGPARADRGPQTAMRFTGLIRLDPAGSDIVRGLLRSNARRPSQCPEPGFWMQGLIALLEMLLDAGQHVLGTSIHGGWAGIDTAADLSKAEQWLREDPFDGVVLSPPTRRRRSPSGPHHPARPGM